MTSVRDEIAVGVCKGDPACPACYDEADAILAALHEAGFAIVPPAESVDTSTWKCDHVLVSTRALRVTAVEHEVVSWEASFCSEDAIPITLNDGPVAIVDSKVREMAVAYTMIGGRHLYVLVPEVES